MAKQRFTMNNFSGGINSVKDPRDIGINEFAFLQGFVVDQDGALRPMIVGTPNSASNHDGKFTNFFKAVSMLVHIQLRLMLL